MKRIAFLFLTFLLLSSCYHVNKPANIPPDPLIPKEELVNILTDVYLAEGAINYKEFEIKNKKIINKISTVYYDQIFNKYHINQRILKENLDYYNSDPENMEHILEEVLARLSRLQSEVENNKWMTDTIQKPTNDSVSSIFHDTLAKADSGNMREPVPDSSLTH